MISLEILKNRRSIRKYLPKKVEEDKVRILLESAMFAPSASNRQPWCFIVFRERKLMNRIMEIHPHARMLETATLGIIICGDLSRQHGPGYWVADCAAATQNILLASTGLELGSCWVGIYPREERMKAFREIFSLPSHIEPFALVALGYPAEEKPVPERFDPAKVFYEKWGNSDPQEK